MTIDVKQQLNEWSCTLQNPVDSQQLKPIFQSIQDLNKQKVERTAQKSLPPIQSDSDWNKEKIKELSKNLLKAKYKALQQEAGPKLHHRIAAWFKFYFFDRPVKINIKHALQLLQMPARPMPPKKSENISISANPVAAQLKILGEKHGAVAAGTSTWEEGPDKQLSLHLVETGSGDCKSYLFTPREDGKYKVTCEGQNIGSEYSDPLEFVRFRQAQLALAEDGQYVRFEVGTQPEGVLYKLYMLDGKDIKETEYVQPYKVKSDGSGYKDQYAFKNAKAAENNVIPESDSNPISAGTEEDAKELLNKDLREGKYAFSANNLYLVVKNETGGNTIEKFSFETLGNSFNYDDVLKKIKPSGAFTDVSANVISLCDLSAKEKQIETIKKLQSFVIQAEFKDIQSAMKPFENASRDPKLLCPYLLKKGDTAATFKIYDPEIVAVDHDISNTLQVLSGGRIRHGGREFASFEQYLEANRINVFFPAALTEHYFGRSQQVNSKDEVEKMLQGMPEGTVCCYTLKDDPTHNLYIARKETSQSVQYMLQNASCDKHEWNLTFQNESGGQLVIDAALAENLMTMPKQDAMRQCMDLVSEVKDPKKLLNRNQIGYELKMTDKPYRFELNEYSQNGKQKSVTICLLNDGSIAQDTEKKWPDFEAFHNDLKNNFVAVKELELKVEQDKQIESHIADLEQKYQTSWCKSVSEADRCIKAARSLGIGQNQYVIAREGATPVLRIMSHAGGIIHSAQVEVQSDGSLKLLRTTPGISVGEDIESHLAGNLIQEVKSRNQFAESIKKMPGFSAKSHKDVEEQFLALVNGHRLTQEELAHGYGFTIEDRDGAQHVFRTTIDQSGKIHSEEITPLKQLDNLDKDKNIFMLQRTDSDRKKEIKRKADSIRTDPGFVYATVTSDGLKNYLQDLFAYSSAGETNDKMWAICEKRETEGGVIGFFKTLGWGPTQETNAFVLAVNRHENGKNSVKTHDVLVARQDGELGFFITDAKQPLASFKEVLQAYGATQSCSQLEKNKKSCTSIEKSIEADSGYYVTQDEQRVDEGLNKGGYAIKKESPGVFVITMKNKSINFMTRTQPGQIVVGEERFANFQEFVKAYLGGNVMSWRQQVKN